MAGAGKASGVRYNYSSNFTFASLLCCIVSSSGGLLFGYDLGITSGVVAMTKFESTFFHDIYEEQYGPDKWKQTNPYCKFNSAILQLFPSSLYIAAFISALAASYVSKWKGRRFCMILAGCFYVVGAILTTAAPAKHSGLAQLIVGRVCLGFGVGFANASVTVYASEMSPPKYRGALTLLFQWCTTFGILCAQLINYGTAYDESNGWRISLAIAALPAIMILVGGFCLPETPSYLISVDRFDEGRKVLQKIRGTDDVEEELNDITVQTRQAQVIKHPLVAFVTQRCYLPYLTLSIVIAICHQLSGSNAINFYSNQIFTVLGSGKRASLLNSVILGCVKCGASVLSIVLVDRVGRRRLLQVGGIVMISSIVCAGAVIGHYFHVNHGKLPTEAAKGVLGCICIFIAAYESSWGPLAWLIPAEIQPAEIRTAGMSVATATNMLFSFVVGQTFLSMMCRLRFWTFIFFAFIVLFGVVFIWCLLPECKGLHIEEVHEAFSRHWVWGKCPSPPRNLALPEVALSEKKNATSIAKGEDIPKQIS